MNKFISPLTWPGGKSKQWNLIKSYFPKETKNLIYIEPFFGGGSVGLNALREDMFNKYYFSDLDENLIFFWKSLSNSEQWNNLNLEKWFYPNSSLEWLKNNKNDAFDGLIFLLKNNLNFNGQSKGTWTQQRLQQNWNLNKYKRIIVCKKLLEENNNKIHFSINDFGLLCSYRWSDKYKKMFVYLDPPYYQKNVYKYNFVEQDWKDLIRVIGELNERGVRFLISINDCPETRYMFKDYYIYEAEWKYTSSNTKKSKVRMGKELIITNYKKEF
ncbi:DNA adenine methylase [Mesoplasma melaleucae]|uniref:Restriction endonuclease subunit M n=1 Tax=Mesoplasma melaleucae TaxID=81459 RepID=A0A2K8NVQ1_9MOLU|nr:DNA adenine methylase [Mesoplasma melaleucae]ATZ17824.1 restriction endonuclease subunit M [Mesoplasma melaleucae]